MKIELTHIKLRDLIDGYRDSQEEGVVGFHGLLDIRPKYQREFIYQEKQRNAVIHTISKGFPLNVMYWVKTSPCPSQGGEMQNSTPNYSSQGRGELPSLGGVGGGQVGLGGKVRYELLDGQQRTISICKYAAGEFMIDWDGDLKYFQILTDEQREQFLDYELLVYICEGTDKEKLDWFRVINIAGEKLEEQEIRNAVYSGAWVMDAKRHFSKTGCPAKGLSDGYLNKKWIRQEGLQTALQWIVQGEAICNRLKRLETASPSSIEEYMALHQNDTQCTELWLYFCAVMNWAKAIFPKKRKELTAIDWGKMYVEFKDQTFDPKALEKRISELMKDGEIQSKSGIYWYVLSGNEQYLNLRTFDDKTKAEVYEIQGGRCANPDCPSNKTIKTREGITVERHRFDFEEMEADHIVPWRLGGLTTKDNCQMLCRHCNRTKSGK